MHRIVKTLLFLLISSSVYCQSIFNTQGTVIDNVTGEKLVGVSVYDTHSKRGTVTNENGEFNLSINKDSAFIKISHISYDGYSFKPKIFVDDAIRLTPSVYTLKEVVVMQNSGLTIMQKAIEKATEDSSSVFYAKAFYQKVAKVGNEYTCLHEIFFFASWNSFGVLQWQPTHARYAQQESLSYVFRNITMLAFNFFGTIVRPTFGNGGEMPNAVYDISSFYEFSITNLINEGTEDEIAVVKCVSKKEKKGSEYFNGEILIKTSNYTILKIHGGLTGHIKFSGKLSESTNTIHLNINFKEQEGNIPVLEYANLTLDMKIKRASLGYRKVKEDVKLIFYEQEKSPSSGLKKAESKDDVQLIKDTAYDPEFWKNNEIIRRTPLEKEIIRSFEKNKFFGNYFSK